MSALIELIKSIIEQMAPALAVALWNYEEGKVDQAKASQELAEEKLQVEKNHEAVDEKYRDCSDLSIVNDAIVNGGGPGGQLGSGDEADSAGPSTSGDNAGTKKTGS